MLTLQIWGLGSVPFFVVALTEAASPRISFASQFKRGIYSTTACEGRQGMATKGIALRAGHMVFEARKRVINAGTQPALFHSVCDPSPWVIRVTSIGAPTPLQTHPNLYEKKVKPTGLKLVMFYLTQNSKF